MFANVSFRVKLLAVVAAPVLVMAGLVWLVVAPRLEATSAAERTLRQSQLGGSALDLLDVLSAEREASVLSVAGGPLPASVDLEASRARVDAALRSFTDTAAGLDSPALRRFVSDALDAARTLAGLRDGVDRGAAPLAEVFDDYTAVAEPFVRLGGNVSAGATDAELIRRGHALDLFVQGAEQTAELRSEVAMRLAEGRFDGAAFGRAAARRENAQRLFDQFESHAPVDDAERYRTLTASPEFVEAERLLDEVVSVGAVASAPTVSVETWLATLGARSDAVAEVQTDLSNRLRAAAADASDAAGASAWWTLVMALAAAGLAVLSAGMLSRSIARRMDRVSEQAEQIATHQLAEVLAATRTGAEAAHALPEVAADGRDEVGRLANAFNAVLGAAVESSLDHARRQHETVTGLLTSLGRRNQSIIERQLEVIDGLEATQEDPDLLAGLFRLDHLATGLRRNAENLLVLASDVAPRGWHEPVAIYDVVRGAASEVEGMDRVRVDVDPADPSLVEGRFAVDLSHLLAELIENATRYSPPQAPVVVRLDYQSGGLLLEVVDQGIGMGPDELAEANRQLASPVALGDLVADRVGFHVASRLAARLGVTVQLAPGDGRGLRAGIVVPFSLLADDPAFVEASLAAEATDPRGDGVASSPAPEHRDPLLPFDLDLEAPALPTPATMPASLAAAPAALAEVPAVPILSVAPMPIVPPASVEPFHHPAPPLVTDAVGHDEAVLLGVGSAGPWTPSHSSAAVGEPVSVVEFRPVDVVAGGPLEPFGPAQVEPAVDAPPVAAPVVGAPSVPFEPFGSLADDADEAPSAFAPAWFEDEPPVRAPDAPVIDGGPVWFDDEDPPEVAAAAGPIWFGAEGPTETTASTVEPPAPVEPAAAAELDAPDESARPAEPTDPLGWFVDERAAAAPPVEVAAVLRPEPGPEPAGPVWFDEELPEPEPEPEPEPRAEPEVLANGLVQRRPGQALEGAGREDAVDGGAFRRLPVPGPATGDEAEAVAAERREALDRLTTGVARGRSLFVRPTGPPADQEVRL